MIVGFTGLVGIVAIASDVSRPFRRGPRIAARSARAREMTSGGTRGDNGNFADAR
jgi:hypothetical protein